MILNTWDSTVQSNGQCRREVKKRVQAGWNRWRRVICDGRIPGRVKGKVYTVRTVRTALLYGLKTVALTKRWN